MGLLQFIERQLNTALPTKCHPDAEVDAKRGGP